MELVHHLICTYLHLWNQQNVYDVVQLFHMIQTFQNLCQLNQRYWKDTNYRKGRWHDRNIL